MKTSSLILLISLFIFSSSHAANLCSQVLNDSGPTASALMKELVDTDLGFLQQVQAQNLSVEQIKNLNQDALSGLNQITQTQSRPTKSISYAEANAFIQKIWQHPVVGKDTRYQRTETSIGYCFGRATFVHLEALRLGYTKDQIRKVWVVGEMDNGIVWDFHVATAIRNQNQEWYVIDTVTGRPLSPEDWYNQFLKMSTDKKLRFFATNPEKFTKAAGSYDRIQLGLDLDKESDWYQNYFKDLMQNFPKKKRIQKDATDQEEEESKHLLRTLFRNIFWLDRS